MNKYMAMATTGLVCLVLLVPSPTSADPVEPLGEAGSALHLPAQTKLCIEMSQELDNSWPLADTVYEWNRNGVNLFTTDVDAIECTAVVIVSKSVDTNYQGLTEFYRKPVVSVHLSNITVDKRSTLCHELGHVLGLPHSDNDSCMNPYATNQLPVVEDLASVSQKSWTVSGAAQGIK